MRRWLPLVTSAMEVPATELFLELRRGHIEAMGKLLPDGAEIIDFLEEHRDYSRGKFDDLVDSVIPHDFWTMPGIRLDIKCNNHAWQLLLRCFDVGRSLNESIPGPAHARQWSRVCRRFLARQRACGRPRWAVPEKNTGTPSFVCVGSVLRRGRRANRKRADATEKRGSNSAFGGLVREHTGRTEPKPFSGFRKAHPLLSEILLKQELGFNRAATRFHHERRPMYFEDVGIYRNLVPHCLGKLLHKFWVAVTRRWLAKSNRTSNVLPP